MPETILVLHNYYKQAGGEDAVFQAEASLLESRGHRVVHYTVHNDDLEGQGYLRLFRDTIWNKEAHRTVSRLIERERPDVLHCHNTFPQLSPAVYYAATRHGVAVVQTLHNFRLTCVNGLLFRDGKPCEDCVGARLPWRGVVHSCYRDSVAASATAAVAMGTHKALGTWSHCVNRFIALTDFARQRFIASGIPEDRIAVKPQFVEGGKAPRRGQQGFALYVGRLSPEKGIATLLEAAEVFAQHVPLKIVGDGPMRESVIAAHRRIPQIEWVGHLSSSQVRVMMEDATCLVVPSVCYEGFPRVIAEAYASALPVVASRIGALGELVGDGETGATAEPGDAGALAKAVLTVGADGALNTKLGQNARRVYETRYTAESNYQQLRTIYRSAMASRACA